eukprot:TRINITY_DN376_c0_g1_i1.p1 TRINITY_DN376_c0_g1~~TRINITY_DN376_c0_g1_i1.p1  ORF type:complete len:1257 (-),score=500.12 TRINITY_DN376_c0_g1_i1:501-4271(-)
MGCGWSAQQSYPELSHAATTTSLILVSPMASLERLRDEPHASSQSNSPEVFAVSAGSPIAGGDFSAGSGASSHSGLSNNTSHSGLSHSPEVFAAAPDHAFVARVPAVAAADDELAEPAAASVRVSDVADVADVVVSMPNGGPVAHQSGRARVAAPAETSFGAGSFFVNSAELVQAFARYVPVAVTSLVAAHPQPPTTPVGIEMRAALLFLDVSGFTALTETLCKMGKIGAELISKHLNSYFSQLIALISQHGGDIVKFDGDALFVLFAADQPAAAADADADADTDATNGPNAGEVPAAEDADRSHGARDEGLRTALIRAAQCMLQIQQELNEFRPVEDVVLRLHSAVVGGELYGMHVGFDRRWDYVVAGRPLSEIRQLDAHAAAGSVVSSAECFALMSDTFDAECVAPGVVRLLVLKPGHGVPLRPLQAPTLSAAMMRSLSYYVPPMLVSRIQARTQWLGELRRVTVLFIKVPDFSFSSPEERAASLGSLHAVVGVVAECMSRHEGTLVQATVDDKGTVIIAAFGMPMQSHEDDPVRGVKAALEICEAFEDRNVSVAVGLTTGTAFCGSVGSPERCTYSVIGDVMNLAARLMTLCAGKHQPDDGPAVLCDLATSQFAGVSAVTSFVPLPPQQLKGKERPVAVFRPLGSPETETSMVTVEHLVGRDNEIAQLHAILNEQVEYSRGRVVVMESPVGMGKTCLRREAHRIAEQYGVACLTGTSEASERSTNFFVFRSVFELLFQQLLARSRSVMWLMRTASMRKSRAVAEERDKTASYYEQIAAFTLLALYRVRKRNPNRQRRLRQMQAVLDKFRVARILRVLNTRLLKHLAFIGPVMGWDWKYPPPEGAADMSDDDRLTASIELMIELMALFQRISGNLLVTLDDCHWMDPLSWRLATELRRELPSVVMLLCARPGVQAPLPYRDFLTSGDTVRMTLKSFEPDETLALIAQHLQVDQHAVPSSVAGLITRKAQGNPLFVGEMTSLLRERKCLEVEDGVVTVDEAALTQVSFPDSIQGVITNRIDHLPAVHQMLIKVASVIGRTFGQKLCVKVSPVPLQPEDFQELLRRDIIRLVPGFDDRLYSFSSLVMVEVAYEMLLFSVKSVVHQQVAKHYEDKYHSDLSKHYATLAYHFIRAVECEEPATRTDALVAKAMLYVRHEIELTMTQLDAAARDQLARKSTDFLDMLSSYRGHPSDGEPPTPRTVATGGNPYRLSNAMFELLRNSRPQGWVEPPQNEMLSDLSLSDVFQFQGTFKNPLF